MIPQDGLGAQLASGNRDRYARTRVGGRADKVRSRDARVARGVSEKEDVEKVVCDAEDGAVCEVELFFPC